MDLEQGTITGTITGGVTVIKDELKPQIDKLDQMIGDNNLNGIKETWQKIKEAIAKIDWERIEKILKDEGLIGEGTTGPDPKQ